ncbi:hypothetical protein [Pontiella agarivorans]|uniref:Cytidyltransferase-like domain-containing protein n=1 Tax=Pontiella agarivorans TaxID=3038953 RepID=A0ABU5N080_9BACT|nr:hypothetical protein [Pontiella agarivorans]MDZ8119833.1 hypothetical protein [Pontiella agarivorans]
MNDKLQQLLDGGIDHVLMGCEKLPANPLFYPGSFNPLHPGHRGLLKTAENLSGRNGVLELSVKNVDKPALEREEIHRRLSGIDLPVVLTRSPTFIEKAELFPGAWFVLGYDTAIRLIDPKYHPDVPAMLQKFQTLETKFIVGGRLHRGRFQTLENVVIPEEFKALFIPVPEDLFRADISSTALRNQ